MERSTYLVELSTEPIANDIPRGPARLEASEKAADQARATLEEPLAQLRAIDPELKVFDQAGIFPVLIITTTKDAIAHLMQNRPANVTAIKDASNPAQLAEVK
jgi:hypothetical protein